MMIIKSYTNHPPSSATPSRHILPAISISIAIYAFIIALREIGNFDIWWHLQVGKYIIQHHTIPLSEIFSNTMAGTAWFPHEWLSELILYLAYSVGGINALGLLAAAIIAATSLVIWQRSRLINNSSIWIIAVFIVWGLLASRFRFMVRPHIFSFLLVNLLLLLLEITKSRRNHPAIWLSLPLMLLWANMHGSFLLGLAFLVVWAVSETIEHKTWLPSLILLLNILIVLVNPGGVNTIISMKDLFTGASLHKSISNAEFAAPTFSGYRLYWSLLAYTLFVLLTTIRRTPPKLLEIAIFAATIYLSLKSVRFIAIFALICPPYIAWRSKLLWDRISSGDKRITGGNYIGAIILFSFMFFGFTSAYNNSKNYHWGLGIDQKTIPVNAVKFLKSTKLNNIRLYNNLEFGGYLTWQLYPRFKISMDGRAEIFNPLEQRLANVNSINQYEKIMQSYNFQIAIIKFSPANGFEEVLKTDPMWRLIYWDDRALIYARSYQVSQDFMTKWEYKFFSPFSLDYSYLKEPVKAGKGEQVLGELSRAIRQNSGHAFKPWVYTAYVEQLMHHPKKAAAAYEKAIAANPILAGGHYQLFATLAKIYVQLGERQKALSYFIKHYAIHLPKGKELHRYALILYRLKDYRKSEKMFKKYLQEEPNNAIALANLGFLFLDTKQYKEATKIFQRSAQFKKDGPGLYGLALTTQKTKGCTEAIPIWQNFIKAQKKPSSWTKEAQSYIKQCQAHSFFRTPLS